MILSTLIPISFFGIIPPGSRKPVAMTLPTYQSAQPKGELSMPERKNIAVGLDGVLAHYDGWKGLENIGEPIPEARQFLIWLRDIANLKVIIHTTRTNLEINRIEIVEIYRRKSKWERVLPSHNEQMIIVKNVVKQWLIDNSMPYDSIWQGNGKPVAVAYIDDRAIAYHRNKPRGYDRITLINEIEEIVGINDTTPSIDRDVT